MSYRTYFLLRETVLLVRALGYLRVVMETDGVVLHEFLHVAVAPASVEVVLLHLRINLIVIPVVVIEPVNSAHHARAMPAAGAVYIKLPG